MRPCGNGRHRLNQVKVMLLDLKALALLQRHLVQEATIAAYQDCFVVVTALCVVVMPLVLFLRRQPAE